MPFFLKQTIHDPTFLAHYESRPEVVGCKGCKIDWVKGKNLTLRPVRKADKNTGKIVTKFAVSIVLTLMNFFGNLGGSVSLFNKSNGAKSHVHSMIYIFNIDYSTKGRTSRARNPAYQGSCIDPTDQSHHLNPTSKASLSILAVPIRLLIKDISTANS